MSYKENADDLAKKYHGTYIKYDGKVVYISHFEPAAGAQILANIQGGDGEGAIQMPIDPDKIESINFDATFINNTKFQSEAAEPAIPCVLVQRKPKRQWKRGICVENTDLKCPLWPIYAAFGKNLANWQGQLTGQLVKRLISPTYPTLEEACKLVESYQAVAISPMFAITLSNISSNRFLLASHFGFIGEADRYSLEVRHAPAFQEVRDFVSRSNQRIGVELR